MLSSIYSLPRSKSVLRPTLVFILPVASRIKQYSLALSGITNTGLARAREAKITIRICKIRLIIPVRPLKGFLLLKNLSLRVQR